MLVRLSMYFTKYGTTCSVQNLTNYIHKDLSREQISRRTLSIQPCKADMHPSPVEQSWLDFQLQSLSSGLKHWMTLEVTLYQLEKIRQDPQLQVSSHFEQRICKHYTTGGRHLSPDKSKANQIGGHVLFVKVAINNSTISLDNWYHMIYMQTSSLTKWQ